MHLCSAGWLAQARVGYPTTYVNAQCGFGHVGIVDYGTRKNLSELWDVFCYRMKGEKRDRKGTCWHCCSCLLPLHLAADFRNQVRVSARLRGRWF